MLGLGAVAQLGERLVCNQEATGSIPVSSTRKSLTDEAITCNPVLGSHGVYVARFDTVGNISGGIEADPVVSAVDLCSDLSVLVLRSMQDVLASRAKDWRAKANLMLGVISDNRESVHGSTKVAWL
jgi:hypothetical protein